MTRAYPASLAAAFARLLTLAALLAAFALPQRVAAQEPTFLLSPPAGEVRVGDRLVLTVDNEAALTDTFTVGAGPAVYLPGIGLVSLAGVTRQGIGEHLTTALARVIRDPVVRVELLVRFAVLGEVARPGFLTLPADALLSDAITMAGGLTPTASLRKVNLTRRGTITYDGDAVRDALASGRTLADLQVEAGDQMMIPRAHDSERTIRIISLLVAIPFTVYILTRM